MIDMIKQSYGYDIFGAKGLSGYISLGKHTSVRKVLQNLHGLRKKGLLRGHKRGINWLWRLPKTDEEPTTPFFPKKEGYDDPNSPNYYKKSKRYKSTHKETTIDENGKIIEVDDSEPEPEPEEIDDTDYGDEEEQDDSKMVYFADPENDEDN